MPSENRDTELDERENSGEHTADKEVSPAEDDDDVPQSTLSIPNYNRELARMDRHFYRVGYGCLVSYVLLTFLASNLTQITEAEECLTMTPLERSAALLTFLAFVLLLVLQYFPVFVTNHRTGYRKISGYMFAGMAVAFTATINSAFMAFAPNPPLVIDTVTTATVHMQRWAEWAPLAFTMTFLVEACDVPHPKSKGMDMLQWAYVNGLAQGASTCMGFMFPLCQNETQWWCCLAFAVTAWQVVFWRLHGKYHRFRKVQKGTRLAELELYNRSLITVRLLTTCAVGWTVVVICYLVFCFYGPKYASPDSILSHRSTPMIAECILDVILKAFYNFYIVSMHNYVFDEGARAKRRLEELRQMMWVHSSDVLAISVKSFSGIVTTTVSPAFFNLLRGKDEKLEQRLREAKIGPKCAMLFSLSPADFDVFVELADGGLPDHKPKIKPFLTNFQGGSSLPSSIASFNNTSNVDDHQGQVVEDVFGDVELRALATLVVRSWDCPGRDTSLPHNLVVRTGEEEKKLRTVQCEAKVTKLEETALFVVVRDISERFRRFEAEKKAYSERAARLRDSETNRFTRHEIKNGLLASLGLCEGVTDSMQPERAHAIIEKLSKSLGDDSADDIRALTSMQDNVSRVVKELDLTLREVLDTVLTEAMARDVIHGVYQPQLEPLAMKDCLQAVVDQQKSSTGRFPVVSSPDPFPQFHFDPYLLKCIHRNAVSNACKYGGRGRPVKTRLSFDDETGIFQMEVKNEPGEHHDELRRLDRKGVSLVFDKGQRLHTKIKEGKEGSKLARHSAGDGAWIMRKCAATLDGGCKIEFLDDSTVFTFWCPAKRYDPSSGPSNDATSGFSFPKETWGIGLDDSGVQRKLLTRLFRLAGIKESRTIVLGETAEEIATFDETMRTFVSEHPNDYFLFIVDENLDVKMDDVSLKHTTYFGSLLVQSLRHHLLPEQECQVLALIRSANDSMHDVAVYKSRAHGFIPKMPLNKERIIETLSQLWLQRFSSLSGDDSSDDMASQQCSTRSATMSVRSNEGSEAALDSDFDVMSGIRAVDKLISSTDVDRLGDLWSEIWEKLHAFKGDLVCMYDSQEAGDIADLISNMRGKILPSNFLTKYQEIRKRVSEMGTKPI